MNQLNHVAIIMDGNGRWALKKKKSRNYGHKEGLKSIDEIIKISIQKKIKFLTLFVFSVDNWKRPKPEVDYLFNILFRFLNNKLNYLHKKKIKLKFIGKKKFTKKLTNLLTYAEKITQKNNILQINLALNYSGKSEIVSAVKKTLNKKLLINEINISNNLYTKNIPDPEILIRTGDTHRLSNFLLWQISYTEIFFEKKMWPDFNKKDFIRILNKFKTIKRNFGSI